MTAKDGKKQEQRKTVKVSLSNMFLQQKKSAAADEPVHQPKIKADPTKSQAKEEFVQKNMSVTTKRFLSSVSSELEHMHKPYMVEHIKSDASAESSGAVVLTLGNKNKNSVFCVSVRGIGNVFYDNFRLTKREVKHIQMQPGHYEIIFFSEKHYINRSHSKIAPDEEWMYKVKSDGTNTVYNIVKLLPGTYNIVLSHNMSKKDFQKLLKELENAPRE